ncbi:LysR family transcriptional regulator [Frankia sp. CcI156]|uniref:Transcriptional regulator, LysR family n=1 Tax=Frankia casuarinae (strain DSM 45818 / CECT 9043 / HFP020203 / CcI3) TaxID=106370 RepID=Q2JAA5_FRACC|nr:MULTISPECIES: LysR family transcriptional regulator [Frankia]ABD11787.1 transcriptional regulator, LysR family [Frankia casuarinae]ETA03371.1 transcriptional regulator [Frankia sp. CcI6]EYT93149.1 transcriptional regulator [Frankia casuarinae]KDA42734.1 transcriptional regulator [Frankia sp. BMG5.23]KEZ35957.1 transcriptional regulator, LysR family [Frankia sp. CeD]
MSPVLDVTALRSFVTIADCGGFRRAAHLLCISQSAVSQHVRRLEKAIGRPLVEPDGRATRFTPDGELLLTAARRILALHDGALEQLGVGRREGGAPAELRTITVGATEHAADHLLPLWMSTLTTGFPEAQIRFRLDRGARLTEALDQGAVDVAVLLGTARGAVARPAGCLPLAWYAAAGWTPPPPDRPLPLVAINDPCTIRSQALSTLARVGRTAWVVGEAGHLAGVLHAARAGVGVALLADVGPVPPGLERRHDLPAVAPEPLHVRVRRGAPPRLGQLVGDAVEAALA